jgi:hypothetical protein
VSEEPREPPPEPAPEGDDDLGEFDFTDPLKRSPDDDDSLPGLDPIVTIPPEE